MSEIADAGLRKAILGDPEERTLPFELEPRKGVTHGVRWFEEQQQWRIVPLDGPEAPQRGAERAASPEAGNPPPAPSSPADALTAPRMRVIGLCGAAGAGKDTVAEFLRAAVPGAKRQGWADSLKLSAARNWLPNAQQDTALDFCNWIKTDAEVQIVCADSGLVVTSATGREFLQRYGTEAHRDVFGQDFWLDAVLPEGRDDCPLLLIPDTRFVNECERIHERGGEVWKVTRPGQATVEAHASESGIPEQHLDREIWNEGSLDELRALALEALNA